MKKKDIGNKIIKEESDLFLKLSESKNDSDDQDLEI